MVWRICSKDDVSIVSNYLVNVDKEKIYPISDFPGGIEGTVDLFFERGKVLVTERDSNLFGLVSYLFGEPSRNYENKTTGYIYLAVLNLENRKNPSIIKDLLEKVTSEMNQDGIKEVKFKACVDNIYTNHLYLKIAKPLCEEINTQGKLCVLYGANLQDWKQRFLRKT